MTESQVVDAVKQQLHAFDSVTATQIKKNIPMGINIFASEYEWEFLSEYLEGVGTKVGTTSGKTYIDIPKEVFKPIVVFNDTHSDIKYIDRKEWAEWQTGSVPQSDPIAYTVFGNKLYLTSPSAGNTVNMVYTRKSENLTLGTVPAQFHPTVVMAVVMWMTPSILKDGNGNEIGNPAFYQAEKRYNRFVSKALGMDLSHKGRTLNFSPNKAMKRAARYAR